MIVHTRARPRAGASMEEWRVGEAGVRRTCAPRRGRARPRVTFIHGRRLGGAVSAGLLGGRQAEAASHLLSTMPHFDRIFRVDEMEARTRALASEHRGVLEVETIGASREGRPVEAVRTGGGAHTLLLLGFPHPDEGVGSLLLDHLIERACARPELLAAFDLRLVAVKCWDIDGAKLNEGWFPGVESFSDQARDHFRPPPAMQMEWTFPVEYKTHRWDLVPPETEAVRKLILAEKPDFMLGLHNAAVHDPYFYLSEPAPGAYGALEAAVVAEGLTLSDRSPDVPFEVPLAPGVFRMYGLRDYFDHYAAHEPHRLAHIRRGACSDEFLARAVPGSFSFNAEVPRMLDPRVRDRAVTATPLAAVLEWRRRAHIREMEALIRRIGPLVREPRDGESLVVQSVRMHIEEYRAREEGGGTLTDPRHELPPAPALPKTAVHGEPMATVADTFEAEVVGPFEDLLVLGEGWRAAAELRAAGVPGAAEARRALGARIDDVSDDLQARSSFAPVTLRAAASVQLRALLALLAWRFGPG